MLNVIGFVLLLATVALLSWASRRAWRRCWPPLWLSSACSRSPGW